MIVPVESEVRFQRLMRRSQSPGRCIRRRLRLREALGQYDIYIDLCRFDSRCLLRKPLVGSLRRDTANCPGFFNLHLIVQWIDDTIQQIEEQLDKNFKNPRWCRVFLLTIVRPRLPHRLLLEPSIVLLPPYSPFLPPLELSPMLFSLRDVDRRIR